MSVWTCQILNLQTAVSCHIGAGNWTQVSSGRALAALMHWAISPALAPSIFKSTLYKLLAFRWKNILVTSSVYFCLLRIHSKQIPHLNHSYYDFLLHWLAEVGRFPKGPLMSHVHPGDLCGGKEKPKLRTQVSLTGQAVHGLFGHRKYTQHRYGSWHNPPWLETAMLAHEVACL